MSSSTRVIALALIMGGFFLLGGCAGPAVQYKTDMHGTGKGDITFYLAGSDLTLLARQSSGKDPVLKGLESRRDFECSAENDEPLCFKDVHAIVSPAEYRGRYYEMVPRDNIWSTTYLSVSYVAGTHLIKQVGSEVLDHRKEVIETAGMILGAGGSRAKKASNEKA